MERRTQLSFPDFTLLLGNLSYPVLRTKPSINHMCAQRSITHIQRQITQSFITSRLIIHYNIIRVITKHSVYSSISHTDINWLTSNLKILRILGESITICYPSGIFIQVKSKDKRKYISYSTKITWSYEAQKDDTG